MKTEEEVLKQLNITSESYIVYWIDKKGEMRKSCTLATSEKMAEEDTKYIYKDFETFLKAEKRDNLV